MKPEGRRRKGSRGERELVKLLDGARIRGRTLTARRVPLSGSMKDTGFGGDVLVGESLFEDEELWEVKRRAQGFKKIYDWLQDAAVVAFRGDRKEWIVCMRLTDYLEPREPQG